MEELVPPPKIVGLTLFFNSNEIVCINNDCLQNLRCLGTIVLFPMLGRVGVWVGWMGGNNQS